MSLRFALLIPFLACTVLFGAEPPAGDGIAFYEQKRYPEAQAAFEARVARDPRDAEAHAYLGRLALARQEFGPAVIHLARAVELAPGNAEYQFQYGSACLQQAGRLGMSLKALSLTRKGRPALEKAVELAPATVAYRQALIEFYAQAPGLAGGGMDKAYAQIEALRPYDDRAATLASANLKFREKKYAEAIARAEDLVRARADDYQALYLIGRIASETGVGLDRGIDVLRACLALPPPPRMVSHAIVNYRLGEALLKKGDRPAARAAYEAALKADPTHAATRTALERLGPG